MTAKIEKVKMFNQILESMIIQLTPIIGTTYHNKLTLIYKTNALLPIKIFSQRIIPIKEKILAKDESYFENSNSLHDLGNMDHNHLNKILSLQNIYVNLDKESKNNIWDIFQALLILACEYNNM